MEHFAFADSLIGQERAATYLRWNLFTGRDQLQFSKDGNKVVIKTLNAQLFDKLKNELQGIKLDSDYLEKIEFVEVANNVMGIEIQLKNESVEMFSFYRERDKKYVVDFWTDISDSVDIKKAGILKPEDDVPSEKIIKAKEKIQIEKIEKEILPAKKVALEKKIQADKDLMNIVVDPSKWNKKSLAEENVEKEDSKKPYRDFRYGATFVWDYEPIVPAYKKLIDLKTKIPEVFYPIANRNIKKNEQEAHLQLTINLYRKKKWGLMYKSMKLFEQKYGANTEWELGEFIKANAILRENIEVPNPDLFKNALAMLSNLSEKTNNYELKKGIYKYLLSYYIEKNDSLEILKISKTYYSGTRDGFDFEESIIPARAMLNSLARLGQVDKIKELAQEKNIKKILPPQLLMSYQSYVYLKTGDLESLINLYEKNKSAFTKPVDPVILYNTAEAYFRQGKFLEAMNLYQEFVKNYSYEYVASNANLRIALCSDLLDANYNETLDLYKRAIDTSINSEVSYEARIRYVAFRSVRKKILTDRDLEIRIFLEADKSAVAIDKNLSKLLQQVRLRSFIVDKKFKEALAYLTLVPTMSMSKIDARVFESDGAEIIYGIITDFYKKSEYSQAIKVWQLYKNKYVDKVAMDPYMNFLIGSSYVKLRLYRGFDEVYASFEKLKDGKKRTFPIWVDRDEELKASDLLTELIIAKDINLKNWELVQKNLSLFEKKLPTYNKINYYRGLAAYNEKNYPLAASSFETFFAKQDQKIIYDPADVAEMIRAYTDSIYEQGQTDKFLKVSNAILNDTNSFGTNNAYIQNVRERIAYLGIEIMSQKGTAVNFMLFEKMIDDFKKNYLKSVYTGRVNYILGQMMVSNQKIKEGRDIFNGLVNDKETSEYIKELAKSELGLLNLKEKTL